VQLWMSRRLPTLSTYFWAGLNLYLRPPWAFFFEKSGFHSFKYLVITAQITRTPLKEIEITFKFLCATSSVGCAVRLVSRWVPRPGLIYGPPSSTRPTSCPALLYLSGEAPALMGVTRSVAEEDPRSCRWTPLALFIF